jgi:opacity protein-like surface antigen
VAILVAIGVMPIVCPRANANESNLDEQLTTVSDETLPFNIAQIPDPALQQRLEEQREAERVLKEGERLRRDVQNDGDRQLENRVGEQINRVRESGANPQRVREADVELNRLRDQSNRTRYYYNDPFYSPYYSIPAPIFAPGWSGVEQPYENESDNFDRRAPRQPGERSSSQILVSTGFKDGQLAPSVGIRFNNIGLEVGGVFNQDNLPGTLNDFSLPSDFLSNDLGIKKVSPQWGADVLGFVDVSPRLALYGSAGIYFQSLSRIAQSQATNELYKQTNDTNVAGAVGGGVTYSPSDSINIGVGYHSLRGITARVGFSF